jgi:hypothetical protein
MSGIFVQGPIYREPPALARFFVYGFALAAPLLTGGVALLPAAIVANAGMGAGIVALAVAAGLAWLGLLVLAVRRVRALAARFTPPLPLPGDIWNIGSPAEKRRSRNWPLRLRRRPPGGGVRTAA